ncbi:hypothetical protein F3I16_08860 [Pseudomonas sp. L-22-4S-12]|uniref:hypothetical protein n=1 Tax=Pseudomonas sp. L-22-4S-12 TaxID=2610893 RepID=UPI00132C4B8E|nr:hypothetical protein [Pseudomonas sp. L-22-4S-12]MWV16159.1 hypothetical protein [Pseudomonas sp. L-22-4S-12]
MPPIAHLLLRTSLVLCLPGLMLLAAGCASHNPAGVVQLFVCSLLISLGLLLFGRERFAPAEPQSREQTRRPA